MTRRAFISATAGGPLLGASKPTVRISVFGLFSPNLLHLKVRNHSQAIRSGGFAMERPELFELSVPNKIRRTFSGRLEVVPGDGALVAVVEMDRETAVAATVAAEGVSNWPPAALEAQAIVTRSYFAAARGRHARFDFCDTTHCQHLKGCPSQANPSWKAVEQTSGAMLLHRGRPVEALFTRSCSGRTRSAVENGFFTDGYPFFPSLCSACSEQPVSWTRVVSKDDAAGLLASPGNEAERLKIVRELGWDRIPSNAYRISRRGDEFVLIGRGEGHGAGLCQRGAAAMAREGASAREILRHYFRQCEIG